MLRVDVTKHLGEFTLSATFTSEGRVTGLFGASGAGKTSLINMIAGLMRPDRGIISLPQMLAGSMSPFITSRRMSRGVATTG